MPAVWIPLEAAQAKLVSFGFGAKDPIVSRLTEYRRGLSSSDLRRVHQGIERMGLDNVRELLTGATGFTAYAEFGRELRRARIQSASPQKFVPATKSPLIDILDVFSHKFVLMARDVRLRQNGYRLVLNTDHADPPFKINLIIRDQNNSDVGRMHFDFFFGKDRRPGVVIGNFQGASHESVTLFRQQTGLTPIDFLVNAFKRGFAKNHVYAVNPVHHYYNRVQNIALPDVASSMHKRGKLTDVEFNAFRNWDPQKESDTEGRRVHELVEAELKRLREDATGMHVSAFARAGFRRQKNHRLWRLKATGPIRKPGK